MTTQRATCLAAAPGGLDASTGPEAGLRVRSTSRRREESGARAWRPRAIHCRATGAGQIGRRSHAEGCGARDSVAVRPTRVECRNRPLDAAGRVGAAEPGRVGTAMRIVTVNVSRTFAADSPRRARNDLARGGTILNVTSITAARGYAGVSVYAASKGASGFACGRLPGC